MTTMLRRSAPTVSRPAVSAALLCAALLAVACSGCGSDGRLPTYPVEGQVIINGQPASGCTVTLVPSDPQLARQMMPGGTTDSSGNFQLTTYETGDGAPAGQYGVTLQWEATDWPGKEAESRMDPAPPIGPDRLMGRFSSVAKSGIEVTVEEAPNRLTPFRLDGVRLMPGSK